MMRLLQYRPTGAYRRDRTIRDLPGPITGSRPTIDPAIERGGMRERSTALMVR